jgi:hypothetical protein
MHSADVPGSPLETAPAEVQVRMMLLCPVCLFCARTIAHPAVGLVVAGLLISGVTLAQECSLTAPLTLKDTQDGFAGQTGTVWTIAPDCSFTVARQLGQKIGDPYKQGRLTPEQQAQLKELLDRMALANLPERLGGGPQVNARRITVSYGEKVSRLTLAPGGGDLSALRAASGDDPAGRMLELADTLKGMTGS